MIEFRLKLSCANDNAFSIFGTFQHNWIKINFL